MKILEKHRSRIENTDRWEITHYTVRVFNFEVVLDMIDTKRMMEHFTPAKLKDLERQFNTGNSAYAKDDKYVNIAQKYCIDNDICMTHRIYLTPPSSYQGGYYIMAKVTLSKDQYDDLQEVIVHEKLTESSKDAYHQSI